VSGPEEGAVNEQVVMLLVALLVLVIVVGSLCGIAAVGRVSALAKSLDSLRNRVDALARSVDRIPKLDAPPAPSGERESAAPAVEREDAALKARDPREDAVRDLAPAPDSRVELAAPSPRVTDPAPPARASSVEARIRRLAESRPAAQDWMKTFESSVGKQWIAWAGAVILFVAAGLFVKLAIDNDWIGETGRVGMGILAGLALLGGGDRFIRRTYRALGLGLVGAGIAVLYVSLYYSCERVLPQAAAFGLMALVTAAGMALAVLHNGIAVGFIAVLGGLLTPLLVSTGSDARDALFAYLLLLDLGVLGVAFYKKWRALDLLAFAGTWILYTGWYAKFHAAPTFSLAPTLVWLGVFYLVFLVVPFAYHLRHATPVPIERFLGSLGNAVLVFSHAYVMLRDEHTHVLGFVALLMAASYVSLGTLVRRRVATDGRALLGFVALAVVFLTLAVPLHLKLHGITLAWAVEGPVILYLGYRFKYFPARALALAVLGCAVFHLVRSHWPLHSMAFAPIFNARFAGAMVVPLAGAAYAAIHRARRAFGTPNDRAMMIGCAVASAFLALVIVHAEIDLAFEYAERAAFDAEYASRCSTAFLWTLGAAAFVLFGARGGGVASRTSALAAEFVAAILTIAAFGTHLGTRHALILNARFAVGLAVVLVVFAHQYVIRRQGDACAERERGLAPTLFWTSVVLLWLLASVETYTYCHDTIGEYREAPWVAQMALSIVWGAYAAALLTVGFWRRMRPLRIVALALIGLTALKLVLVDMATVKQMYRVVSFLVLGIVMIGTSYLYHRIELWLETPSPKEKT
jgi:uncharacterized membrane protein